jgi:RNA polymerase sigma factor (sigma-70 family)
MQNKELLVHIEGCRRSREKSRSWIFNRYYRLMFGVCLRYVSDKDAVQDVVQEGFLKIFSNIDGYTSKGSFEGWMRRIMVNTAIDAIRSRKSTGLVLGLEESFEEIADEVVFPIEEDDDVENFRTVFNLYVFDNMGHKEISDHLGISVGTSKSNLAKARKNLRKILLNIKNKTDHV